MCEHETIIILAPRLIFPTRTKNVKRTLTKLISKGFQLEDFYIIKKNNNTYTLYKYENGKWTTKEINEEHINKLKESFKNTINEEKINELCKLLS